MKYKKLEIFVALTVLLTATACQSSAKSDHDTDGHSEHEEHGDAIELTEKQMKTVGIELGTFSTRPMGETITATGELMVDQGNIAEVTPLMNGIITRLTVREGDYVNAGAVVATLENLETNTLVRDYTESLRVLRISENEYERQKKLSKYGAGVAKNLERAAIELETARSVADTYRSQLKKAGIDIGLTDKSFDKISATVKAPISGIITKIYGNIGGEAGISSPILTITDDRGVFALVRIYEKDLDKIKKGMSAEISLTNGSGIMRGNVENIIKVIDPDSKTIGVRIRIEDNDKNRLLPGMAVNANIYTGESVTSVLPEEAVVSVEGKDYIYVLTDKEHNPETTSFTFRPVEVVKGNSRNGWVEIKTLEDLPSDSEIVISKAFYIASKAADHGEHGH